MTISQVGLTHEGGHHQNTAKIQLKYSQKYHRPKRQKYGIVKYGCKNIGARPVTDRHTQRHMPTTSTAR